MSSKLISIIIGLILVLGTGSAVYQKKQTNMAAVLDNVNTGIINSPSGGVENNLVQNPTTPTPSKIVVPVKQKEYEGENEGDDDEDEGGSYTTPVTTPAPTPAPTPNPTPTPAPTPTGITMAQVAAHASHTSCWSAVNGSVYDLTSWIPNHPGGERTILSMCGKDGSSAYSGQHGSSSRPAAILFGFKLGALAK